jgi:hypothetical protein
MRRWIIAAVAFPIAAWLLDRLADYVAERRGEGPVTRVMRIPQNRRHARSMR